jgi:uncharacterized membrane protein
MGTQRWVYVLLIVVGILLGAAIAGVRSRHYDPPIRVVATTTTSTPVAK